MYYNNEETLNVIIHEVSQPCDIEEFQIRYYYGETVIYPIEELYMVDELIRSEGRDSIAKISFYFRHPQYSFYNLILYNEGDHFRVKFADNALTFEDKHYDYDKVMYAINNCRNLDDRLGKYVQNPFV
jgi:hypothetical protein